MVLAQFFFFFGDLPQDISLSDIQTSFARVSKLCLHSGLSPAYPLKTVAFLGHRFRVPQALSGL